MSDVDLTTDDAETAALMALYPVIDKAARAVAFQWPGVVEQDDVGQMIATHMWERPSSLLKVSKMESASRYRAVVGIGHQLASKERADYDYYKGAYRYSVQEVKALLKRGVLVSDVGGFDEAVSDLMEALEALTTKTPQYVEAVVSRYADEEVPKTKSGKDALSRGLTSVANAMNKSNKRRHMERDDGPGTRKVLSNAQAQAITDHQYDGDGDFDDLVEIDTGSGGFR